MKISTKNYNMQHSKITYKIKVYTRNFIGIPGIFKLNFNQLLIFKLSIYKISFDHWSEIPPNTSEGQRNFKNKRDILIKKRLI